MARVKRRRAGRPRKDAPRTPTGQISRAGQSMILPETIAQREKMAPGVSPKVLRVAGGTPLSILALRGDITGRQEDAGEKLGKLWRRWSAAAGAQPRTQVSEHRGIADDITEDEWRYLSSTMKAVDMALRGCQHSGLVSSVLESVCVDEVMPMYLAPGHGKRRALLMALHDGLDEMARFFRIPMEDAA